MAAESTVRILFLGDSAQAVRSVSRLESSFGSLGRAGKLLAGALAVGIVGGLAAATKAAIDFQKSMELIKTQAGASQGEVDRMSKSVLNLAKSVGTGPQELAKGLFHVESAGFRAGHALKVLTAAAKGAKVGQADLETVTNALIAAQTTQIKGAGDAAHTMAVLNAAVGAGNMRMQDLAGAMGTGILSSAKSFGLSLQDVTTAIATMTVRGQSAEQSATRLRMAFSLMAAPTGAAIKALKTIGLTQSDLANEMRDHGLIAAMTMLRDHLKNSGKTATEQSQVIAAAFGGGRTSGGILTLVQNISDMQKRLAQTNATTKDFGKNWVATQQTVSYKLEQAKASIQAAAIPIGTLLLPLLIKAADAAANFADSVGKHMPQIQADFQRLSGVVSTLYSALGQLATVAISPVGQASLLGILAGVGAAKAISGLSGLAVKAGEASVGMTRLGVAGLAMGGGWGTAIAVGVGLAAGAIYLLSQQSGLAAQQVKAVSDALNGLVTASQAATDSANNLTQAHIDVKTTALAVHDAEKVYAQAVRESGRNSEAAQKAELALTQARLNHKRALDAVDTATKEHTKTQREQTKAANEAAQKLTNLQSKMALLVPTNARASASWRGHALSVQDFVQQMQGVVAKVRDAAAAIPATNNAAKLAAEELQRAADAAANLARELGRIPTRKDIKVYYQQINEGPGSARFGGPRRAAGGFIPGPSPGAPVPILAHAGEVVLNREQQAAFGGPHTIARMFGFTGDEGPGFAAGGVVNRKPHRKRHPRHRSVRREATKAVHAVTVINQEEDDADRSYGQLERQYQIADSAGADVTTQLSEIDSLIAARNHMLELLAEEKKALEKAIKELILAIKAMQAQIKRERAAVAALAKKVSDEQKKKKPNTNLISSWQNQISAAGTRIGNLQSSIGDFQGSLGDERMNLVHQLPFDVRDVQLDIADLQQRRTGVSAPTGPSGVGGTGPDMSELLAEIAKLQLALGIQSAQQAVIGSFAKGTLSVPETGLALVHAGEQIVPAGQVKGGDGGTYGPIQVNLSLSGPLEPLAQFITATVDSPQVADRLSVRIGQRATERARSGRF